MTAIGGQLARFAVVGAANTLLSLAAFRLLVAVGLPATAATVPAFLAGAVNGYCWNRRWTFAAPGSTATRVRYLVVQLACLGATTGLYALTRSYPATLLVVTLLGFAANRCWTFTARPQPGQGDRPVARRMLRA